MNESGWREWYGIVAEKAERIAVANLQRLQEEGAFDGQKPEEAAERRNAAIHDAWTRALKHSS